MVLAIHTGSSQQIFDLIAQAEKHQKIVWTTGGAKGSGAQELKVTRMYNRSRNSGG